MSPRAAAPAPAVVELTRANPATAEVLANQRIVGRGALREVRHVELSFPGLGNLYKAGDALGIVHRNPEPAIDAVLKATKLDAAATVTHDGKTHTLLEWLRDERELTRIARPLLVQVAKHANVDISELLGNAQAMAKLTATCQVSDMLGSYPAEWTPEALVNVLRPVTGRVYSIASSPAAVGDEAHLTVAVVGSDTDRKLLAGAASHFVVNTAVDSNVQVWIEKNERFRVPADGSRDIIMVGPGTGVAPFRGFVQEREAAGATRPQLAVLRRPLAVPRLPLPARMAAGAQAQVAASRGRGVLARPGRKDLRAAPHPRRPARSSSPGCRTVPISMCAVTRPPWRPT